MGAVQWRLFFEKGNGRFSRKIDIDVILCPLSERYKRNSCYQVVGMLDSFIANRQNDFIQMVHRSSIDDNKELKKQLFRINKSKKWFLKEDEKFSAEELFLARKIFKEILSKHRKPRYDSINMMLNKNVAEIFPCDKKDSPEFDYWIKFSTLTKGEPILLPLKTNKFFDSKKGTLKNSVQVNKTKEDKLQIVLMKQISKRSIEFKNDKIAIDTGLASLFTVDGNMFGKHIYKYLKQYDKIISELVRNRQLQGLPIKCKRYDQLVKTVKNYLKNEINRLLNKIIKKYSPKTIIVEYLNFKKANLSKSLNRIISNFGMGTIRKKLENISQEFGIEIQKVNPAYSSQECSSCGYVDKNNRKKQESFKCLSCRKICNADVNASRVLFKRSSSKELSNIYFGKDRILRILVSQYKERKSRHYSLAKLPFRDNPYFKEKTENGKLIDLAKDHEIKQKEAA